MSNFTSFDDKVRWLLDTTKWTQDTLAREIGVSQSTVARWVNGAPPYKGHKNIVDILSRLVSEKALLCGSSCITTVHNWSFICARTQDYSAEYRSYADAVLKNTLIAIDAAKTSIQKTDDMDGYSFLFSCFSLSVPFLNHSGRAYTFADDRERPKRFMILVNSHLSPTEQNEELSREMIAHVHPYIANLRFPIQSKYKLL